jgi:threonine/homoserine/homoserine lactone efflux protein
MTSSAFLLAVLALLLAPGPTNTLMGIAGARGGIGAVMRLLPAELLGYITTVLPLAWLGAELLAGSQGAALALKACASAWIMFLSVKLWRMPGEPGGDDEITPHRVYVTTVLNPKALIFGLVLLPAPVEPQFLPKFGLFCLMVTGIAVLWGGIGRLTRTDGKGGRRLLLMQRLASIWLAIVSVSLISSVMRS